MEYLREDTNIYLYIVVYVFAFYVLCILEYHLYIANIYLYIVVYVFSCMFYVLCILGYNLYSKHISIYCGSCIFLYVLCSLYSGILIYMANKATELETLNCTKPSLRNSFSLKMKKKIKEDMNVRIGDIQENQARH